MPLRHLLQNKKSDDEIGKIVDSFNLYISKLKKGYIEDGQVIENVDEVIDKISQGFYVYKIEKTSSSPQIQRLRDSINHMIERTNENLVSLNNTLIEYGNSNFQGVDSKIETTYRDWCDVIFSNKYSINRTYSFRVFINDSSNWYKVK